LPTGIETLLDLGSGAGFPGIPIALCHPEVAVTLAESQGKKAAFLQEAVRSLEISARVHSARAELLQRGFDCVTLRAVDKMPEAVQTACDLVARGGWLVLMTTEVEWNQLKSRIGTAFRESTVHQLNGTEHRILVLIQKSRNEQSEPTGIC
jgi:16S rRNA (guanine527-N7)-methyltransferase